MITAFILGEMESFTVFGFRHVGDVLRESHMGRDYFERGIEIRDESNCFNDEKRGRFFVAREERRELHSF